MDTWKIVRGVMILNDTVFYWMDWQKMIHVLDPCDFRLERWWQGWLFVMLILFNFASMVFGAIEDWGNDYFFFSCYIASLEKSIYACIVISITSVFIFLLADLVKSSGQLSFCYVQDAPRHNSILRKYCPLFFLFQNDEFSTGHHSGTVLFL